MTITELEKLLFEVTERATSPLDKYTQGYVDALRYLIEWMEEEQ